jgi:PAS domain S-box-containing protein
MNIFTTILIEFLFVTSSILFLFRFRSKLGLAPLYILLGAIQYLQVSSGTNFSFQVFGEYTIYSRSVIIFSALLFAVLLIYIKESATSAQTLILGIIVSNILLTILAGVTYSQENVLDLINADSTKTSFFTDYKYFIVGTIILFFDFFLLIILYQFLITKIKKLHFFLILFISLTTVLVFDSLVFNLVLKSGSPDFTNSLIGHIIGKLIAAFAFSLILYVYLKYLDKEGRNISFIANEDADIFSILRYRKKYLSLKIEKNKTEKRLVSQLESSLNNVSDGFVSIDAKWRYIFVNIKAGEFLGKSPEYLIGKHIWTEFPEGVGLPFYKAYYKATETQQTQIFQEYYPPYEKWFENRVYPSAEGLTIYFTDITELKEAENQIIKSEKLFRDLTSNAPVAIFQTDKEGYCNYVNEEWVKYAGMPFEAAMGYGWTNAIHPEDRERVIQEWQKSLQSGNKFISEFRFLNGKNQITWLSAKAVGIYNAQNQLYGYIGMALDITEKIEVQKEVTKYKNHLEELVEIRTTELEKEKIKAQSADLMKSAFLATMSHELRTPMNSIIGFTGILLKEFAGPLNEEQKKQLSMVKNSGQHLLGLINDILDISKIEAGKLKVSKSPFNYITTLEKSIEFIKPQINKKGLQISAEFAKKEIILNSDERRIEQILLNLISNAIKFSNQGTILIKVDIDNNFVTTQVIDQGIGIDKEEIIKLFMPFIQLDGGLSRNHEGTGLGLAICKRLIEKLGGSIEVQSKKGEGSNFNFKLPLE